MKIQTLLESAPSIRDVSRAIYELVLKHIKTDPETLRNIKFEMFETDRFWSDEMHTVTDKLRRSSSNIESAIDAIFAAVDEIGEYITGFYRTDADQHFLYDLHDDPNSLDHADKRDQIPGDMGGKHDPWDHPPGYKPPKLKFDSEDVTWEEASDLVEKLAPELFKRHKEREAAEKKLSQEQHKRAVKEVQKVLPELATAIIKVYAKAWDNQYEYLKKRPNDLDVKNFIDERGIDLKVIKSGAQLSDHVRKGTWKNAETEWMNDTYENITGFSLLKDDLESALIVTMRHKPTEKKLWTMVKDKLP